MSKHSSRSHCIFTINVLADVKNNNDTVKSLRKLHSVDLAGSENTKNASLGSRRSPVSLFCSFFFLLLLLSVSFLNKAFLSVNIIWKTGSARERERLNINRSLLTLGRVIAAVKDASSGKKNIRIPYRFVPIVFLFWLWSFFRCQNSSLTKPFPSFVNRDEADHLRPTKRRRIEALVHDNFIIGDWSPFVRKIAAFNCGKWDVT